MVRYSLSEILEPSEYIDFLRRSDLGSQYPAQDFERRIERLLKNTDLCITARNEAGLLVGICFGVTDFAYFLFVTDLGIDRDYVKQGIGKELLALAHRKAGGEDDITMTTIANEEAIGFYEACGLRSRPELMVKYCAQWESFTVR